MPSGQGDLVTGGQEYLYYCRVEATGGCSFIARSSQRVQTACKSQEQGCKKMVNSKEILENDCTARVGRRLWPR